MSSVFESDPATPLRSAQDDGMGGVPRYDGMGGVPRDDGVGGVPRDDGMGGVPRDDGDGFGSQYLHRGL